VVVVEEEEKQQCRVAAGTSNGQDERIERSAPASEERAVEEDTRRVIESAGNERTAALPRSCCCSLPISPDKTHSLLHHPSPSDQAGLSLSGLVECCSLRSISCRVGSCHQDGKCWVLWTLLRMTVRAIKASRSRHFFDKPVRACDVSTASFTTNTVLTSRAHTHRQYKWYAGTRQAEGPCHCAFISIDKEISLQFVGSRRHGWHCTTIHEIYLLVGGVSRLALRPRWCRRRNRSALSHQRSDNLLPARVLKHAGMTLSGKLGSLFRSMACSAETMKCSM